MCKRRYRLYKDSHRESCPCKEKFDFEFKKWILYEGRTKQRRKKHIDNLTKTNGTKLIFSNLKQLNKWLSEIGCE